MAAEPAATLYICKKLGFDVTGIDNSPGAVRVCRERGLSKVKLRPISHIDKFSSNSFDTVLMLGNNFGLFGGLRAARRTLKSLGRITNAGAVIIAESTDPHNTSDRVHLEYLKLNRRRRRMPGQIRIRARFSTTVGPWFDYLLVSEAEMAQVLEGSGWRIERTIRSEGRPQYIAIIRKEPVG